VELGEVVGQPAVVVNTMSRELMGPVGGVLALLGVAAAPISSGDGAFRSARLNLSDIFKIKQGPIKNRFMLAFPLFAVGIGLTFVDFQIIWRYFAWANQTLATVALWAAVVYLCKRGFNYWIALVPAMFMSVVVTSYILIAPEGLVALLPFKDTATIELVGDSIGVLVSVICTALFFKNKNMIQSTIQKETIPQLSMTEQNIEDIEEQIIPE
jgi:carbon starvation protein CstA